MKDELIINGKKYVHVPEVKEEKKVERRVVTIEKNLVRGLDKFTYSDSIQLVELREGEKILSEDDVRKAWISLGYENPINPIDLIRELGFKKDGV